MNKNLYAVAVSVDNDNIIQEIVEASDKYEALLAYSVADEEWFFNTIDIALCEDYTFKKLRKLFRKDYGTLVVVTKI